MPLFENVSVDLGSEPKDQPALKLRPPSIVLIGWIPFFEDVSELPDCAFRDLANSHHRPSALNPETHLFRSGNPRPDNIASEADLEGLVKSREFRSAVGITSIEVLQSHSGEFIRCEFKRTFETGYTRLPLGKEWWCEGFGAGDHLVRLDRHGLTIQVWHRFKMGRVAELGNLALTGHWAPFAVCSLIYQLSVKREVTCEVHLSAVPNQESVISWAPPSVLYSMLSADEESIRGFFGAGKGKDAPVTVSRKLNLGAASSIKTAG